MDRRAFVLGSLGVAVGAIVGTPAATPKATTERIACDELDMYLNDIYEAFPNTLSREDYARLQGAWPGPSMWRTMSATDLYIAVSLYNDWAKDLRSRDDDVPAGLMQYHESRTRNIELIAEKIDAYAFSDRDRYEELASETIQVWETGYSVEQEGVRQCGDEWIATFGEPWNPHSDKGTPAS